MFKKFLMAIFVLMFLCGSHISYAILQLEITGGNDLGYPIGVVDFPSSGASAQSKELARIIRNDLTFSGKFSPLSPNSLPENPSNKEAMNLSLWNDKVASVVVGLVKVVDGKLQFIYQLVDVNSGNIVLGKTVTFSEKQIRLAAHTVSNQIYEAILNEKGAFLTKIAYVNVNFSQKYPYRLVIADYDGYNDRVILQSKEPIMSPTWDPKGDKIAYVSFESRHPAIYVQNLKTKERQKLVQFSGINGSPVYSPQGDKMAMVLSKDGNPEIYVLNIAAKSLQRITNNRVIDTEPTWDPTGKYLYFSSERGGKPQIYRVELANPGNVARVTWENVSNLDPTVSPDGKSIAFITRVGSSYRIAKQDIDTKYMMILTKNNFDESPCFAPNGSMIIYSTVVRGKKSLALVSADGRFQANLPSTSGIIRAPSWSPFFN